ncbi:RlpA-like double-psi beta-barrel-protein domain-containing protein-containing protein [Sporodiniella umbellata]|nr:RlpA-like double-psi beta-barrel-protein domain-containing protein-containing protein [Sporodiniella umbellata]
MRFFFFALIFISYCILCRSQPVSERGLKEKLLNTVHKVGDLLFKGRATIFDPVTEGGSQGACGPFSDKDSMIAAMNAKDYGDMSKKSHWCGKTLRIKYKEKMVKATVTDACPGCAKGCLDLTPAVWTKLETDTNIGIIDITWEEWD